MGILREGFGGAVQDPWEPATGVETKATKGIEEVVLATPGGSGGFKPKEEGLNLSI